MNIVQGKLQLRIGEEKFDEGVHFAADRVNNTLVLLIDSNLGKRGDLLRLKEQVDYTRPLIKKTRKKAQWKTR